MTPENERKFNELAAQLRNIPPDRLERLLNKGAVINFRLSLVEKEAITQRAASFGLSVTEYILRLHNIVEKLMSDMPLFDREEPPTPPAKKVIKSTGLRRGKYSPRKQAEIKEKFLTKLAAGATIKEACLAAGITPPTFRDWREKDDNFRESVEKS